MHVVCETMMFAQSLIDDGINVVKALTKNGSVVPGAGATEIELARLVSDFGDTCTGLEQVIITVNKSKFPSILLSNTLKHLKEFLTFSQRTLVILEQRWCPICTPHINKA